MARISEELQARLHFAENRTKLSPFRKNLQRLDLFEQYIKELQETNQPFDCHIRRIITETTDNFEYLNILEKYNFSFPITQEMLNERISHSHIVQYYLNKGEFSLQEALSYCNLSNICNTMNFILHNHINNTSSKYHQNEDDFLQNLYRYAIDTGNQNSTLLQWILEFKRELIQKQDLLNIQRKSDFVQFVISIL